MKRAIPLLLLAPFLAACGSSHMRGSYAIDYGPQVPRSAVTPIATQRERQAGREAQKLLNRIPLPPGATRLGGALPATDQLNQSGLGVSIVAMTADRYSFWRLHGSGQAVIAFEERHVPAGLHRLGLGSTSGGWGGEEFDGPVVDGSPRRAVTVMVEPGGGGTLLRLDAGVSWIYPRSPKEVVPARVREIDVRDEKVVRHVTGSAKVRQIIRWFDELNVSQPGPSVSCMAVLGTRIMFAFRSAGGARLASAVAPSGAANNCDSISFSIGGKRQWSLIDATNGKDAFARRVERLLGVNFPACPASVPRRACR
ncbi:MAG: hypothetical protein ACRDLM_08660 [Gaiellaceae bacterium]